MQHCSRLFLGFLLAIASISVHPAFQQHFENIINANPCLRQCMNQVSEFGQEMSLLKTANISGYFLNIGSICGAIGEARDCIDGCGVPSNPFALESMKVMCTDEALEEVDMTRQCMEQRGNAIVEQCQSSCGDHRQINDQVHQLSQKGNEPQRAWQAVQKVGQACATLKCSHRCVVNMLADQCDPMNVGSVVKALVEKVIAAQRRDMEKLKMLETVTHTMPKQCNYMYSPEAMFDETKDDSVEPTEMSPNSNQWGRPSLKELEAYLLQKQLQLLDLKERNLLKENKKLDLEMQMLVRKRL